MAIGKHYMLLGLCAAVVALPAQAQSGRALASALAEISQNFVCPEFQPDDAARRTELVSFSRALASVGPTRISYPQAALIRGKILQRHNCARPDTTLANSEAITPLPSDATTVAITGGNVPN